MEKKQFDTLYSIFLLVYFINWLDVCKNTTYNDFRFMVNTSYNVGVATTIPADSCRFSRMGIYADIKLSRIKCDIYSYGVYQSAVYHNVGTPWNYYLNVVYK